MKVLIVDDERAIRYSLKEILEMDNYQVELAENGLKAVMLFFRAGPGAPAQRIITIIAIISQPVKYVFPFY